MHNIVQDMLRMDASNTTPVNTATTKPYSPAAIISLVAGIIISASAYLLVSSWEQSLLNRSFESDSQNYFSSIKTEIIRTQEVVSSISGLFSSSQFVSRNEFRMFVKDSLATHPGIQALSWNPVIKRAELDKYIQLARQDGFENFKITELTPKSGRKKLTTYDDLVVVFYIEPYKGNEKAMGFNIVSNPSRLKAIQKACNTNQMVVTERVKLIQEKYGYLIFKAVYKQGKPIETVSQRQQAFTGLAVGVFRFGDMFAQSARFTPPAGIDMWISDLSAPVDMQLLHYSPAKDHVQRPTASSDNYLAAKTGLYHKIKAPVLDRNWEFLFSATPAYFKDKKQWQSKISFIAGILFTLLLSLYLQSRHKQVADLAIKNNELIEENKIRKLYEQKAKEQRDFSNTILEASANVIVVIDLDGCFVVFNPAAEKITGFSADEVLGVPIWKTVIPTEQEPGIRNVFENLKQGKLEVASEYENEWLTKDGERRLLRWNNSVLYNDNGKISYIMALGYDITEQREYQRKQERLNSELMQAQKMQSLGQLTGGIAHDFNNILGIILGYSDLAINRYSDAGDEELTRYLQSIYDAGERASKLIEQMLTFSRGDQTKNVPIKFAPLIRDEITMLRSTLPSTIEIVDSIDSFLPYVYMNTTQLHQILMNLSINAADAMNSTGTLTIKLSLAKDLDTESPISHKPIKGDWVELSVSDTGTGVDATIINNIFDPFFTTKEVGKGTGMGLSVIYRIMQDHDGHILVESEAGKGTTFRMLFPPMNTSENTEPDAVQNNREISKGHSEEILIVDDEEMLAKQINELVKNYNYKGHYLTDSKEALELFKKEPDRFALLITDQTMPNLTGIELIEKIREIRPGFPVIMCSGYSNRIDADTAAKLEITYFDKPVDIKKLLLSIADKINKE